MTAVSQMLAPDGVTRVSDKDDPYDDLRKTSAMSLTQHHKSHDGLLAATWERIKADFRDFRFTWGGFWRWTGITLGAILVAALVTLYFLDWNQLRGPIGRWASHHFGRDVRIDGDLKVKL